MKIWTATSIWARAHQVRHRVQFRCWQKKARSGNGGELVETSFPVFAAACVASSRSGWRKQARILIKRIITIRWRRRPQVVAYERSTLHGLLLNAKNECITAR